MIDPPRAAVPDAVGKCRSAGIKVASSLRPWHPLCVLLGTLLVALSPGGHMASWFSHLEYSRLPSFSYHQKRPHSIKTLV